MGSIFKAEKIIIKINEMKYLYTISLGILLTTAKAQTGQIDSSYNNTYYQGRMELFANLPAPKHATVFLGNSITERGMWHELVPGKVIMNRGIGGDNTFGVLARLDAIVASQPKKIFLLIGVNDMFRKLPYEVTINNYKRIITRIKKGSPKTTVYIQSVLPINEDLTTVPYAVGRNAMVTELNRQIKELAAKENLTYINLHPLFADEQGKLKKELTMDGVHLKPAAYKLWVSFLKEQNYL
jgi:lysophospholipase L1-like esterase